uniref:T9SS type A sorting domain-containing protein n=1 Tax=uncultured Maribacter sp. TaxID=431308 RepID=UPI0026213BC1
VATFFQNGSYEGTSWEFGIGDYADITLEGMLDNDASSLQIEPGYVVELYSEKDFEGEVLALEENISFLGTSDFNDKVSSIKIYEFIEPSLPTVVTFFRDGSYEGISWEFGIGNYIDITLEGMLDNDASSLQIEPGYVVELYSEKDFEGEMVELKENSSFLGFSDFNDKVSSVKIYEIIVPTVATFFQNGSYEGTSWEFGIGDYADITLEGMLDNDASSLQIEPGYVVELYSEKDFEGEMVVLKENSSFLGFSDFNDKVSSTKVYEITAATVVTFFRNGSYEGTSWEFGIGDYADITLEGMLDNDASSLQIEPGYVVELYSEKDFEGEVLALEENISFLGTSDFNDKVSSIKIYEFIETPIPTVATLFQHSSYSGISWELGIGDFADITLEGISDNDASSLQIEPGYVVELYSEKNFEGEVLILDSDTGFLSNSSFNDITSSVKIYEFVEPALTTLFQDISYGGTSWNLGIGEYGDISLEGIQLNDIGSVQVADGYVVELYPDLNFGGIPLILKSNTNNLVTLGMNDEAESVKVFLDDCKCTSGEYSLLVNGSFEETSNPAYATTFDLIEDLGSTYNSVKFIDAHTDSDFPGWFTTGGIALQQGGFSQGGTLELGQSGFLGITAPDGSVFIEMDANHHHQIITVTPGQLLDWELSHRGRPGDDEITISAGPIGNQEVIAVVSSPNTQWVSHAGQYQVPAGVSEIQFTITPSGAGDGDIDSSNLLDFVKLCPSSGTTNNTTSLRAKISKKLPISLYPNPVEDIFYLHTEEMLSQSSFVYIYSASGVLVKKQNIIFENGRDVEIFVDELSSGIYTILIANDKGESIALQIYKN